jgi:hypothetical protein
MLTHNAEYFRQRRRARGIPVYDPFSVPEYLRRAAELQRLERLRWPRNRLGHPATIAELTADAAWFAINMQP